MKRQPLARKRLRTAMYPHFCCVCLGPIESGQVYRDGGDWRKAHFSCSEQAAAEPEMEHDKSTTRVAAECYYANKAKEVCADSGPKVNLIEEPFL